MIFHRIPTVLFFSMLVLVSPWIPANTPAESSMEIAKLLPQQCYFSGSFVQTRKIESLPAPLESRGNFLFSCDHGLIWHTESPSSQTLIYTNDKKYFQVDTDAQVKPLKGRIHSNMALLLNGLMGADTHYLEKYFTVESVTGDSIELQPKKKNMRKFIHLLSLRKGDDTVEISMASNADNSTRIDIFDIDTLNGIDAEECRRHYAEAVCSSLLNVSGG